MFENNRNVLQGIHLYININNLNSMIKKEEANKNDLTRIFYAMDGYLSSIENFLVRYDGQAYVEKLTSSRMHLVFLICDNMISSFLDTVKYAFELPSIMHSKIDKFSRIDEFQIGMGADFGYFVNFEFTDKETMGNISELTSIGFPANRAAKLQSEAGNGEIIVSEEILRLIVQQEIKGVVSYSVPIERRVKLISKYESLRPYIISLKNMEVSNLFESNKEDSILKLKEKIQVNFQDIEFSDSTKALDFSTLSLKQSKRIIGCVLYADIRGFTKKFNKDGSNLLSMAKLTKNVLRKMYFCVIKTDGVHIQFQGDRESAIDNDYPTRKKNYALDCILCGMEILDEINQINDDLELQSALEGKRLAVGIGCSIGTIFATRIGVRDSKDNLILGETVHEADIAEDNEAKENEFVITSEMYDYLETLNDSSKISFLIKNIFKKRNNYYVTSIGLKDYRKMYQEFIQQDNGKEAKKQGDLKPWCNI